MIRLEEIKEGIASKEGYGCWKDDMLAGAQEVCSTKHLDELVDKVATTAVNTSLQMAAEEIEERIKSYKKSKKFWQDRAFQTDKEAALIVQTIRRINSRLHEADHIKRLILSLKIT